MLFDIILALQIHNYSVNFSDTTYSSILARYFTWIMMQISLNIRAIMSPNIMEDMVWCPGLSLSSISSGHSMVSFQIVNMKSALIIFFTTILILEVNCNENFEGHLIRICVIYLKRLCDANKNDQKQWRDCHLHVSIWMFKLKSSFVSVMLN